MSADVRGVTAQILMDYLSAGQFRPVECKAIVDAHPDIDPATVRTVLRRLVKRNELVQPWRGYYLLPSNAKAAEVGA